ncbi:MAG TPA: hypothetical protein VGO58_10235 [Chitinophagaceae bacterium]|jgi:hypothetical protein|nr:hypothetical protein [Chitinophagaceae bacterium]
MSATYRMALTVITVLVLQATADAQDYRLASGAIATPNYFFTVDPAPDPALRHNRLLQERAGEGMLTQVGAFKVKGNPNIFGGKNKGDMFAAGTKAYNIFLSYNTYNQELGFYSTSNPAQALYKVPGEVDSFVLHADKEAGIENPVKFIYGSHIGSKDKAYYQEVYSGKNYSIYKKYTSELGYVSSSYSQSDLRQFDLVAEYFYAGSDKKLKKIKAGTANVVKEFKGVKDLSGLIADDAFTLNADEAFRKVFDYINQ